MCYVEDIERIVSVNIKNIEALSQLLLFIVIIKEDLELLNELINVNLDSVISLCYPEVKHFAKVWFIFTNNSMDILDEVLL